MVLLGTSRIHRKHAHLVFFFQHILDHPQPMFMSKTKSLIFASRKNWSLLSHCINRKNSSTELSFHLSIRNEDRAVHRVYQPPQCSFPKSGGDVTSPKTGLLHSMLPNADQMLQSRTLFIFYARRALHHPYPRIRIDPRSHRQIKMATR